MSIVKTLKYTTFAAVASLLLFSGYLMVFGDTQLGGQTDIQYDQELRSKSKKDKANKKGQDIAKLNINGQYVDQTYDVRIDIQELKAIDGGVEILARAWKDTSNDQLGFGVDGSVDIERFKIFNPPVLVDDPTGTIVRSWEEETSPDVFVQKERKLKRDEEKAIKEALAHTVLVSGQTGTDIIAGKIGNTSGTIYADTTDGQLRGSCPDGGTWAQIRNGGCSSYVRTVLQTASASGSYFNAITNSGSNWGLVYRELLAFDVVTEVGAGATINSGTVSMYGTGKGTFGGNVPNMAVYDNDWDGDAIATGDWTTFGSQLSDTVIAYSSISTSGYNDFSLNTAGITDVQAGVDGSGYFDLGFENKNYDIDSGSPASAVSSGMSWSGYYADESGTATDPKLVIDYDAAATSDDGTENMLFDIVSKILNVAIAKEN